MTGERLEQESGLEGDGDEDYMGVGRGDCLQLTVAGAWAESKERNWDPEPGEHLRLNRLCLPIRGLGAEAYSAAESNQLHRRERDLAWRSHRHGLQADP